MDHFFFIIHTVNLINKRHHLSLIIIFSSESDQEVLVHDYFMLDGEEQPCSAPFGWLVRMHLESLWEESEFMPGVSWSQSFLMTRYINS